VKGVVKNITDYGAFVDLGGIDGLLHITDLAWRRVKHPTEVLAVGDEVTAKILKFDAEKNRVSLGLKQLGEDPWIGISRRYPQGTRLFGKVTNITDYGAFVEIESGIEGLVHVSEMDWTNKNVHPAKVVSLGDEVEVMILEIDEDRRRISLGMKQCMPNPWEEFAMNHKKGDKVKGVDQVHHRLRRVHRAAGQHRRPRAPLRPFLAGDRRRGREVAQEGRRGRDRGAVDRRRARAHLARHQAARGRPVRQLRGHPRQGQRRQGHVKSIEPKGAVIELEKDVEGYLRASEISRDRVEDVRSHLKEGDELEMVIVNIDRKSRSINLSIKQKDAAEEAAALQKHCRISKRERRHHEPGRVAEGEARIIEQGISDKS
jgi:small subunit ribosomal protein S1